MPTIDLTKRAVDRLPAPDPSGRQALYWDKGQRGFGVLVSGTTTSKSYIAQRKIKGSQKTRRVTIDRTDLISLEEARERARRFTRMCRAIQQIAGPGKCRRNPG